MLKDPPDEEDADQHLGKGSALGKGAEDRREEQEVQKDERSNRRSSPRGQAHHCCPQSNDHPGKAEEGCKLIALYKEIEIRVPRERPCACRQETQGADAIGPSGEPEQCSVHQGTHRWSAQHPGSAAKAALNDCPLIEREGALLAAFVSCNPLLYGAFSDGAFL